MKIAICSTHCNGKTTLVEAFKKNWPMYVSPKKTYRDLIKEKGLNINRQGDVESQAVIRDALFEQAHQMADQKFSIVDRNLLDNMVYTMYLAQKEDDRFAYIEDPDERENKLTFSTDFISESIKMCREAMRKCDIIFWLPLNSGIKLDDINNPNRDTDAQFRIEINNIFQSIYHSYQTTGTTIFFDPTDQPAIIPLEGNLVEKLQTIAEYIGEDGNLVEEESILASLEQEYDKLQLLNEFSATIKK